MNGTQGVRDTSKKIKSVYKAKGLPGKHVASSCPYGYLRDEHDGNHWIVDEEAAEIVRRDEDQALYPTFIQSCSDNSLINNINGIGLEVDFTTNKVGTNLQILGTSQRIYVYAEGSGADFVANTLLRRTNVMSPWGFETDATIAGCTLIDLSDTTGIQDNDIPIVYIGKEEPILQELKAKCGEVLSEKEINFVSEYEEFIGTHRREDSILLRMNMYEQEGIVEEIKTVSLPTGEIDFWTGEEIEKI